MELEITVVCPNCESHLHGIIEGVKSKGDKLEFIVSTKPCEDCRLQEVANNDGYEPE